MTKRQLCSACSKPLPTCICSYIQRVDNLVSVIILQHPIEVDEAKNTVRLLHHCLKNSQVIVGESFSEDFFQTSGNSDYYDLLLYPRTPDDNLAGMNAAPELDLLRLNATGLNNLRLWVLDATWRKSRKMLYLNPNLQAMPRLSLDGCPASIYTIRKAHSKNQLSSLEATCYALQQLEDKTVDYSPVLNAFAAFVAQQQTFLPSAS